MGRLVTVSLKQHPFIFSPNNSLQTIKPVGDIYLHLRGKTLGHIHPKLLTSLQYLSNVVIGGG